MAKDVAGRWNDQTMPWAESVASLNGRVTDMESHYKELQKLVTESYVVQGKESQQLLQESQQLLPEIQSLRDAFLEVKRKEEAIEACFSSILSSSSLLNLFRGHRDVVC